MQLKGWADSQAASGAPVKQQSLIALLLQLQQQEEGKIKFRGRIALN
jgi:hypothetical protein